MMINAYANGNGQPPRPSTSPVPNFFSSPAAGRKQQFRASQHLQQQADKLALANSVRNLRPLPPASRNANNGGGASFGSLMIIEGKTTGEEIQRSTTDRREVPPPIAEAASSSWAARVPTPSGTTKGATTAATPTTNDSEADRQRARSRKLEAELKKALDQVKRKTSEATVLQAQTDALQSALDNAKSILADADKAHATRLGAKQAECDELKRAREVLQKQLDDARKDADSQRNSLAANSDAKTTALQEAWAQERTALQSALADGKRDADTQRRRADLLQTQLDAARSDLASSQRQVENERMARERSDAVNIARMAELEREAAEARAELAQWRERIRQVDAFVLEICQPQFSVVKDESLKPMEVPASRPGSSERAGQQAAGFVLVPLQLLLQGYALLPKEKKQSIADRYESSKARDGY